MRTSAVVYLRSAFIVLSKTEKLFIRVRYMGLLIDLLKHQIIAAFMTLECILLHTLLRSYLTGHGDWGRQVVSGFYDDARVPHQSRTPQQTL